MNRNLNNKMTNGEVAEFLEHLPEEVLSRLTFAMPWQYSSTTDEADDADGFTISGGKGTTQYTREVLQEECWNKFHRNPFISTSIRGVVGRMAGWGFECSSLIDEVQDIIEEIELDWRNRLYHFWPKYVGRYKIEGELPLCLTCHADGFVEVDFIDPVCIKGGGDDDTGIIYHPSKSVMPLFFSIDDGNGNQQQIPSVFIAKYPELIEIASKHKDFNPKLQEKSKSSNKIFKKFNGFYKFILYWDAGFCTRRAVSHLRTVLEWLNHYENLKKYEIDHKKSSGAYVWVIKMTDPKAFKLWLSLSDADKKKTGIMAKKTPGGTMILPPGMDMVAVNPNLTSIKEQDTDILHMIGGGLDEPEDVMTGASKGTFASVKASRGPMSDRTSDEVVYFFRFLKYDFWGSIFYLKSKITGFPEFIRVREAISFDDSNEPVFKTKRRHPEQLVEISFPVSEVIDLEGRARALLGVKHGPISETLGIPNAEVAKKLGFGGYGRARLRKATEDKYFPPLVYAADAESLQEIEEGEPKKSKNGIKKDLKKAKEA